MNQTADHRWCQVIGAEKLPAEIGGADALCAAVGQALQAVSPKPAAITLDVVSRFKIAAMVTLADGRHLPAVNVGSADRPLGRTAIQMLADGIAAHIAQQVSR